jgi:hypothetical protein
MYVYYIPVRMYSYSRTCIHTYIHTYHAGIYDDAFPESEVVSRYTGILQTFSQRINSVLNVSQGNTTAKLGTVGRTVANSQFKTNAYKITTSCAKGTPIQFIGVPMLYKDDVLFSNTLKNISDGVYDLVIMPPTLSLCATSYGLTHLLTRVRKRAAYAHEDGLLRAGGVVFTRAHNYVIKSFKDLTGRIVVAPE